MNEHLQKLVETLSQQSAADSIDQLAVGAAVVAQGKLLLVTRADDEDVFPSHVEIPGGSVDPGESLLEAVEREMVEETGLRPTCVKEYLGSFDFTLNDGRTVRQFNFLLETDTSDVYLNPKEHSSFYWWTPGDEAYLDLILMTPLMRECVMGIVEKIV